MYFFISCDKRDTNNIQEGEPFSTSYYHMCDGIVAFCTRKTTSHKEGKMIMNSTVDYCILGTKNGLITFGEKGVSSFASQNDIDLEKNNVNLDDVNGYMHDSYKRKYGHTWDLNSKDAYTFQKYDELIYAFDLALNLAYDDVMLIVDNFDDCSKEMKLRLIFAVVDMVARHEKKSNKTVDEKMEEVLSSLSDI